MFEANQKAARELSTARTTEERDAIYRCLYLDEFSQIGDVAPLRYHLGKLETFMSHQTAVSYAIPEARSVRDSQYAVLAKMCTEMIESELIHVPNERREEFIKVWASLRQLILCIFQYDGEPTPLHQGIRLSHIGAQVLINICQTNGRDSSSSICFFNEEAEFAKRLRIPLSGKATFSDQVHAIVLEVEGAVELLNRC